MQLAVQGLPSGTMKCRPLIDFPSRLASLLGECVLIGIRYNDAREIVADRSAIDAYRLRSKRRHSNSTLKDQSWSEPRITGVPCRNPFETSYGEFQFDSCC